MSSKKFQEVRRVTRRYKSYKNYKTLQELQEVTRRYKSYNKLQDYTKLQEVLRVTRITRSYKSYKKIQELQEQCCVWRCLFVMRCPAALHRTLTSTHLPAYDLTHQCVPTV